MNTVFGASAWTEDGTDLFVDFDLDEDTSAGDLTIFDGNVIDAGGVQGSLSGECVVLPGDDSYCYMTFKFSQGSLSLQGGFDSAMAITGGTGCFQGVTGAFRGQSLVEDEEYYDEYYNENAGYEYEFLIDGITDLDVECNSEMFEFPWFEFGSEVWIDYDQDGDDSTGDLYLFDNLVVVQNIGGIVGRLSGVCSLMQNPNDLSDVSFCTITFAFDNGEVVIQGFSTDMTIVAGAGCYADVEGTAQAGFVSEEVFGYTFDLAS